MKKENRVTHWLSSTNAIAFNLYCVVAAFSVYFCMYAFRKPFAVGKFPEIVHLPFLSIDYKTILLISQLVGYTISKYIGIKVISEMGKNWRALSIILMIGFSEFTLLFFPLVPAPYGAIFLFLNGIPLGMIWGLVFAYLEGRRSTEVLAAGLSVSYIVASGAVKSVGLWLMTQWHVPETWMPVATGAVFFPFLLLFVYMLSLIPAPSKEDEQMRTVRIPMNKEERKKFFFSYAPGLIVLIGLYMFLTAYRDFRDNFAREIWDALGYKDAAWVYTISEIPIALLVLLTIALVMFIRNNKTGLLTIHGIMIAGAAWIGISTLAFQFNIIGPALWMTNVGLGVYLAYVPYGCVLFDRMIAYIGFVGTAGFMIYLADALGYSASVAVMLYKNFGHAKLPWLTFFQYFSYITSIVCTLALIFSMIYFSKMEGKN